MLDISIYIFIISLKVYDFDIFLFLVTANGCCAMVYVASLNAPSVTKVMTLYVVTKALSRQTLAAQLTQTIAQIIL